MKANSDKHDAMMRAQVRRMRARYRRTLIIIGLGFFIIGAVAGVFAYRWYSGRTPGGAKIVSRLLPEATAEPEVTPEPEDIAQPWQSVPQGEAQPQGGAEEQAPAAEPEVVPGGAQGEGEPQPEGQQVEAPAEVTPEVTAAPAEAPVEAPAEATPEVTAVPTQAPTAVPDMPSEMVPEYDPTAGEVPAEYLMLKDENGEAEAAPAEGEQAVEAAPAEAAPAEGEQAVEAAPAEAAPAEGEQAVEAAPAEEAPAEAEPAEAAPAEGEATEEAPVEQPAVPEGPQVIAIVPYGESFTYTTQIRADGSARLDATDEPYETISFTQTMKEYMRPTDFASKYSTQYKLQGNEAGAGFELVLNNYAGTSTVVPQNVVDISLRSESGNSVERGYQLMDAEIAGNYGIALTTNTPKMLYKRYQYSNAGEEMYYLVVTTYNEGVSQMILFELEDHNPAPEPEIVYTTLQRGIVSDDVANMQARLIELGYLKGTADGQFGPMTEEAIKAAQQAFGMEANGIADNAFQQKLFEGATPAPAGETAAEEEAPAEDTVG